MTKVFNTKKVNWLKQPMFFGAEPNTQRFDQQKYPVFEKLNQQQLGFFWRPEEVSLQKDRNDYHLLSDDQKHIFTSNLKYQTLLDSVQGRGPCLAFLPFCSLPELESMLVAWDFSETIHSRSYTYIMKNVYPDPTAVLDTIVETPEIMDRAKTVTESYDKFIEYAHKFHLMGEGTTKELKKLLYLTLVNVNILEGIRFYVSFACSFAFGELKLMEGSAKIISLIARDENLHLAVTQNIINNYRNKENDKEMLQVIKETEQEVYDMYNIAVQQEKDWAKYLFKDGSMIGLNDTLLNQYVEFMANKRMKAIGLKPQYDQPQSNNPLPWTTHWLNSRGLQNAPQETEIESYVVGGIKQDVETDSFKGFQL
ncbi:MAG: ribonucleotide-diphosphate reductase subunit beta [Pelagibacteraceae bacterium]|nr:ribonucleotide-diphosphate reductase subunit beta [Pelagibacteraceae bacterium]